MCLRALAVVLVAAAILGGTQVAEAKKCANKSWYKHNNCGFAPYKHNVKGYHLGYVRPGKHSTRATAQHAINAWQPTGQARATAQHAINNGASFGKHRGIVSSKHWYKDHGKDKHW